ncbi:RUS1 family protein homolog,RUS1 family protein C16orf58 homolog,RUS1 family protein C16orf58 [Mytilus edulis]|uniref:RUS1 family protein homolog,RUS1 family protein C16orf58 homolog,RUS1 family protein C16orf58 n=1 Tax=Mytilus edulis TaxID=6550 RepID=A0A8S3T352_MYTED|nr:RUS1 family protein homolog,RUS1 family protein C16orf58 homolog,RUS1 family protein C16orf58 [Mytilus edulis]
MNQDIVVCQEVYGSSNVKKKYILERSGSVTSVDLSPKFTSVSHFFRSVFLPQGYPESVSSDYVTYQIWDTIQAFCSSITGTLAHQAVLKGVGVGDETATVLAATLTWLLKDGTGMLGRILFAWMQGTSLDCDAKRWRLFADILNDLAIFMEILAPSFPWLFTPIVCTAGVCKSIVGVAGGATRAALTQHQARRNNMADVSAKDGSQETLVNLAGLIINFLLIPIVTGKPMIIWSLFVIFTCLHLFANYRAVTCVVMESLNQARLNIIIKDYIKTGIIPQPKIVNFKEPVIWKTRRKLQIYLGSSISYVCKSSKDLQSMLHIYRDSQYLLMIDLKNSCINIVLSQSSTIEDQIQSCLQAEIINYVYEMLYVPDQTPQKNIDSIAEFLINGDCGSTSHQSYHYTLSIIDRFREDLHDSGWLTDPVLLGPQEWRCTWDINGLSDKKHY